MTLALVLSPHLDDAILSCAGRIRRHVAQGDRVELLTAFSHADPHDAADWAARRREDEAAAARLGALPRWLGLPDAPFRDPSYVDLDALTGPHAPADAAWRRRLEQRLREALEAEPPRSLYVPLGVGDHVDHRLVHEAVAAILPDLTPVVRGAVRWYEDQPYALVLHAIARRLHALGLHADELAPLPATPEAFLEALAHAPYIQTYLPPGPARERCFARVRSQPPRSRARPSMPPRSRIRAELEPLDDVTAALAEQAIWDYRSQAPALFHTRERYRELQRAHAERLGAPGPRVERYWQDVEPAASSA